ncbi:hypothetical protein yc1106_07694 [Curvularia clavata]|uniref:SpvB-domain-containing protein n=1 Tax=Curvularia clavata TaxID=95742 RepID=A0A9Q8ZEV1_CURCL|nr:hypothetical protein yc1106_07694 [Curvularia clavata]
MDPAEDVEPMDARSSVEHKRYGDTPSRGNQALYHRLLAEDTRRHPVTSACGRLSAPKVTVMMKFRPERPGVPLPTPQPLASPPSSSTLAQSGGPLPTAPAGPPAQNHTRLNNTAQPSTPASGSKTRDAPGNTEAEWERGAPPPVQTSFSSSGKGGGAFRPISENFELNPANGTFSLSLPIITTPGRYGSGPKLGLSYSSGGGNGPFGFGWSLAVPAIARNTSRGIPKYDTDDVFVLSGGDDLVAVGGGDKTVSGFTVRRYRSRIEEESVRIERWTSNADASNVHWRSITTDNTTSIYGRDDMSRIFDDSTGPKRVFSWLLCRSYDSDGNAIEYEYKLEDSVGVTDSTPVPIWERYRTDEMRRRQRYIKAIRYGNRTANRDLETWSATIWSTDWMFEVVFDYGEHDADCPRPSDKGSWPVRKDVFSNCTSGFELRSYRLCRRILMFHHFPGRRGGSQDGLVSSTTFSYRETNRGTFLLSSTTAGHTRISPNQYHTETMPPFSFVYTTAPSPKALKLKTADTSSLYHLPTSLCTLAEWVDLDGEGAPGLLTRHEDGTMLYQRNKNALRPTDDASNFASIRAVLTHPNVPSGPKHYFEDLDRSGKQDLVCLDEQGRLHGFFERASDATTCNGWFNFANFKSVPNLDLLAEDVLRMDLTGDGLLDVLHSMNGTNSIVWQQSLAKEGLSQERRAQCPKLDGLQQIKSTGGTRTYTSDMTGDGLTDVIEISNGKISYWPNLGHGQFGDEVRMHNAPRMDSDDLFNHARIKLLDIDGSGVTDLLYLLPDGGMNVYYNFAGNQWSHPVYIAAVPAFDSLSSVFTLDLFGTGTSCLCWTASADANSQLPSLKYLDLTNGKPNLLRGYTNGLGLSVTINYKPSTAYYLEDESHGRQWETKLPFPVQCVEKLVQTDNVVNISKTTTFAYHDGYYNSAEREFQGFGMVEQWEDEDVAMSGGQHFQRPSIHTKLWFSTGARAGISSLDHSFLKSERIQTEILGDVAQAHKAEAYRSLRGKKLRSELYSNDGTDKAALPHQVEEHSYNVCQVKAPSNYGTGIFKVLERETLSHHYDRQTQDPRIQHSIVLQHNEYGDVKQKVNVSYGRTEASMDSVLTEDDRNKQSEAAVVYSEVSYTNEIEGNEDFRKPLPWAHRTYRVYGLSTEKILQCETLRGLSLDKLTELPSENVHRELLSEDRSHYTTQNLNSTMPDGLIETYSVLRRSFQLAMLKDHIDLELLYKTKVDKEPFNPIQVLKTEGGYVDLDGDGRWWIPSARHLFADSEASDVQLSQARRSFYIPTITETPLHCRTTITLDGDKLLPVSVEDSIGKITTLENDYERMKTVRIQDPNNIVQEVFYDCFGSLLSSATSTSDGLEGDSLEGTLAITDAAQVESFFADPSEMKATTLLRNAAHRTVFDVLRYHRTIATATTESTAPSPAVVANIVRDRSYRETREPTLHIKLTYLNGRGQPVQTVQLADATEAQAQWVFEEYVVSDWSGTALQTYQPFYSESFQFMPQSSISTPCTMSLLDALNRVIGTLRPDFTWSKIVQTPWATTTHDFGDTILIADPAKDIDVGPHLSRITSGKNVMSWIQKRQKGGAQDREAAEKSKVYSNTPSTTYLDAAGRPILVLEDCGKDAQYTTRTDYDAAGNMIAQYDSLDRLAEKRRYNMLQQCIYCGSMDAGETWVLDNFRGNLMRTRNSRDNFTRYVYDKLAREVESWVKVAKGEEKKVLSVEYGEQAPDPEKSKLNGKIWRICDQSGVSANTAFDIRGNCTRSTFKLAEDYKSVLDWSDTVTLKGTSPLSQTFIYDSLGNLIEQEDVEGNRRQYTYTRLGEMKTVFYATSPDNSGSAPGAWTPCVLNTTYSADGLLQRIDYGNKTFTTFEYDSETRNLTRQRTVRNAEKVLEDRFNYYDCMEKVVHSVDNAGDTEYFRNWQVRPVSDFTYDARGQLVIARGREQIDESAGGKTFARPYSAELSSKAAGLGNGNSLCEYSEFYKYDLAGNISQVKHDASQDTTISGWTRNYQYEEKSILQAPSSNNRLTKTLIGDVEENYGYDNDAGRIGCITAMPGYSSLRWNYSGLLASSSMQKSSNGTPETTYYVYNYLGDRVRKVTESYTSATAATPPRMLKETLYVGDVEIFKRFKGDGVTVETHLSSSGVVGTQRIAVVEKNVLSGATLVRYQIGRSMELDDLGQLISYEEYSPFGACTFIMRQTQVEASRAYRFQRYLRDVETGLDYCKARYYAPWLGKWMAPDPVGLADGFNLYCYCNNDPVNYRDPEGTMKRPVRSLYANLVQVAQNSGNAESKSGKDKDENAELRKQIAKLEKQQKKESTRNESLARRLANVRTAHSELQIKSQAEATKITTLEKDKTDLQTDVSDLKTANKNLERENRDLKDENIALKGEVKGLRKTPDDQYEGKNWWGKLKQEGKDGWNQARNRKAAAFFGVVLALYNIGGGTYGIWSAASTSNQTTPIINATNFSNVTNNYYYCSSDGGACNLNSSDNQSRMLVQESPWAFRDNSSQDNSQRRFLRGPVSGGV